jgi:hypothetical protein
MSSITQSATLSGFGETQLLGEVSGRGLARRVCQAMVMLPLFSLILLPEYAQGLGDLGAKSILYRETIGPLRIVDAMLLGMVVVHSVVWATSRRARLHFPKTVGVPGLGFLVAVGLAMTYGWLHGGTNLFFDWRALALGMGLYGVFAMWVQTPREARWAMHLFAAYMALRIGLIYVSFLRGGGDVIVGLRIPVFDGPTLSAVVFTGVLALWMSDCATGKVRKFLWMVLSGAAYLLVLLCFRRTFWAELALATALLLMLVRHHRKRRLLLAIAAVTVVATVLGPAFYERMRSMDFTTSESEFSQDNPDHVGEVLDAWEQVQRQPLLGIGLGRSFPTLRIQEWKEESVMVHNAPLHVWLKYGLVGLGCYVWFHFALFRWLRRRHRELVAEGQVLTGAALLFLVAQFAVSLGFTPWPYSSLQTTTLIAFLLAVAITGTSQCRFQPYPSSPLR